MKFENTIDRWLGALANYDWKHIHLNPGAGQWSIGQVYMHLIEETNWFLDQADQCFSNVENQNGEMSPAGKEMFLNDSFPDALIRKDPLIPHEVARPESIEQIESGLSLLKGKAAHVWDKIQGNQRFGKSKHPGHLYFTPAEWLQYAEMHLRHHFRQKERTDRFLESLTDKDQMIQVGVTVNLPAQDVWRLWTSPEHVARWNNIDVSWHTPHVEIDLKEGGRFLYRMESKDGTQGFDHKGVFDRVEVHQCIEYTLEDGRKSRIIFVPGRDAVAITETFDPEKETPIDVQREFCRQILDSFKTYAESMTARSDHALVK